MELDGGVRMKMNKKHQKYALGVVLAMSVAMLSSTTYNVNAASLTVASKSVETKETSEEFGLEYSLLEDGSGYTVVAYTGNNPIVVIPEEYNGLPVKKIEAYAFATYTKKTVNFGGAMEWITVEENDTLESIEIPDSVTSIGNNAFAGCIALKSVKLSNNLTAIKAGTFSNCDSLESIELPNSVISIGGEAFSGCESLKSVTIPNGVPSIGKETFAYCSSLENITIPNSVISIESGAFKNCSSLTSIELSENILRMGLEVFEGCSSLTSIEIPASIIYFGYDDFLRVRDPDGLYMFENCPSLKSIIVTPGSYAEKCAIESGYADKLIKKNCVEH